MAQRLEAGRIENGVTLSVANLSVAFGNSGRLAPVLRNVSFDIPRSHTVAIVGESGSGKTTLGQTIAGLLPPHAQITGGQVLFRTGNSTSDLARLSPGSADFRALRGRRIGMVFQEPSAALAPVYTVGNLLIEALKAHERVSPAEAKERAEAMLDRVGFLKPSAAMHQYPFELSGGLKQRAMIAAALICKPDLLIADEPTSALDVTVQAMLLHLLNELKDALSMSLLLITHDLGVVATAAQSTAVLYRGSVVESGDTDELLRDPQHPYLKALLEAAPRIAGDARGRLKPLRDAPSAGAALKQHWRRSVPAAALKAPLLTASGLIKRYPARAHSIMQKADAESGMLAVNSVSLSIRRGEGFALVGESGCGKTTLCRMILKAVKPDAGTLSFGLDGQNQDVFALEGPALLTYRARVQYVFQDPFGSLNPRHTARIILREPFIVHGQDDAKTRNAWAAELMELVGLNPAMLDRYPNAFSGGQRQRLAIARALALKPELLVLDEPVSALDVSVQAQVLNMLQDLKAALGLTTLFVSHNLAVVRHVADRVAVMCRGRIVEQAPTSELFSNPRHPYTKALMAAVPDPDPDARLDLRALLEGRASDPVAWDLPFRLAGDAPCRYETVGEDHIVAVA